MEQLFNQKVKDNPLQTKNDIERALIDLCRPILRQSDGSMLGRIKIGTSGSVYIEDKRKIEGFLRLLWGVGPLFSQEAKIKQYPELYRFVTDGIIAGTNPESKNFWGSDLDDYDQLFVEMGSLGAFLIETKENFWDSLSIKEKNNIYGWLNQINNHEIPHTNWLFFRILVNSFFKSAELLVDEELFKSDLKEVNEYYIDHGWYFDGYINQIDYYIPFAMHYYGLLYGKLVGEFDVENKAKFDSRAMLFANQFKNWFTANGAALPFGRSQTYRFAQSAFWDVLAFSDVKVPGLSMGQIKHLALNNLRYWFKLPIFSTDGFLTVGYGYQNLVMAEGYNAPGSPYWAFKDFILLALPDDHPFWDAIEEEVQFDQKDYQVEPRMLLVHGDGGQELQAFTAGQHSHEHAHASAKYEKYVYSTTFGFSVPKAQVLLKQGAFDSTLAISETGSNYQTVYGYHDYEVNQDFVYGDWKPLPEVDIRTYIVPCYPWHVRIHKIKTNRHLFLADGGFAVPADNSNTSTLDKGVYQVSSVGLSGAVSIKGEFEAEILNVEPNTNMLFERSVIPTLTKEIDAGEYTLITAFIGSPSLKNIAETPKVIVKEKQIEIQYKKGIQKINIGGFSDARKNKN
jgi:hypothetical protein